MTTEQCFSLLLNMRRGEKVYICTTTDEKAYSRNSLFVNMFGDIITITGNYVGNLRDSNIKIIVK